MRIDKFLKRPFTFIFLLLLPMFSGCSSNQEFTSDKVTVYVGEVAKSDEINLFFKGNEKKIPYISLDQFTSLFNELLENKYELVSKSSQQLATVKRKDNHEYVTFDCKKDIIHISDINRFLIDSNRELLSLLEIFCIARRNAESKKSILKIDEQNSVFIKGEPLDINLKDYHLDLQWVEGHGLMPLQIISCLFFPRVTTGMVYNGEMLAILPGGGWGDPLLKELFYSVEDKSVSKTFAEFNYNTLCLTLDFNFGLKERHDVKTFDEFFKRTGFDKRLKSLDVNEVDTTLDYFIKNVISDFHTTFQAHSPLNDKEEYVSPQANEYTAQFLSDIYKNKALYQSLTGCENVDTPTYIETEDTAILHFTTFNIDDDTDFYQTKFVPSMDNKWWVEANDTLGLIQHAHYRISHNPNIKRVVLDLSNNIGGVIDSASYLLSWINGKPQSYSYTGLVDTIIPNINYFKDNITNECISLAAIADVNLDGKFDKKDFLHNYVEDVYCLTSATSFSCGNFVPCSIKNTRSGTIVGQKSSGGTCGVFSASTANGALFNFSSPFQLSSYVNGRHESNENGATPDIYVEDLSLLYKPTFVNEGGNIKTIYRGELLKLLDSIK